MPKPKPGQRYCACGEKILARKRCLDCHAALIKERKRQTDQRKRARARNEKAASKGVEQPEP